LSWIRIHIVKMVTFTKINLQIQCNAHLNWNVILHGDSKNSPKIHMEAEQKTLNSQNNSEQKEQCRSYYNLISNYIQKHSNKNSMVLV
jgi:hypothetical protein